MLFEDEHQIASGMRGEGGRGLRQRVRHGRSNNAGRNNNNGGIDDYDGAVAGAGGGVSVEK